MQSNNEAMIDEIMGRPYHRVVVRDEDGAYSAQVLEFDGCFSGGESAAEAATNIETAMRLWIDGELAQGRDVPMPFGSQGYSGRLNLRIPESLHERASIRAAVEGTSLNQLLVTAVAEYMGATTRSNRQPVTIRWIDAHNPTLAQLDIAKSFKAATLMMTGGLNEAWWGSPSNAPRQMSVRLLSSATMEV